MPKTVKEKSFFGCIDYDVGVYKYMLKPQRGKRKKGITVINAARTQEVNYDLPVSKGIDFGAGIRSMVFPGWGQFYRNQNFSGYLLAGSSLYFAAQGMYYRSIALKDYDDYKATTDYTAMAETRYKFRNHIAAMNTSLTFGAATWALGVTDAFLQPRYPISLSNNEHELRENLPWNEEYKTTWGTDKDNGAIGIVSYYRDSEIWIKHMEEKDYVYYGRCNLGVDFNVTFFVPLRVGKYNVRVKSPTRKVMNTLVTVEGATRTLIFVGPRELRDSFAKRLVLGLVPGLHQVVSQRDFFKAVKIWAFQGLTIAGYMITSANHKDAIDKYGLATMPDDIQFEKERAYATSTWRSGFMGLSVGIYLSNLKDAIRSGE